MPTEHLNGIDLHWEQAGEGPRLLMFNGSGSTIERMRPLFDALGTQFDVVLHDQRGLGRTEIPAGPYSMAEYAADAVALVDFLGWDTFNVIGISFGGMVAQEFAVTVPERVERLAPEWLAAHPADQLFVDGISGQYGAKAGSEAERGEIEQLNARSVHDVWDRLEHITAPTFIGAGRYDGIAPLSNSEAMADRIPNAELHVYEGGHGFFAQDATAFPDVFKFLGS